MRVPQVDGGVKDADHVGWIKLIAVNWGITRSGAGVPGQGVPGSPNFTDITVSKYLDTATPTLFILSCNGRVLNEIVIEAVRTYGLNYTECRYTLTRASIAGVDHRAEDSGPDASLFEQVRIRFAQIKVEYIGLNDKGNPLAAAQATWSVEQNRPV